MNKPLKVGFDLDGVILYNPVRTLRPFSAFVSKLIFKKKTTNFFIPKSPIAKYLWYLLHKSSFVPARGLDELKRLVQEGKVEAHLVTGRYSSLAHDFEGWMKSINADKIFASQSHNASNEQPHIFKKNMIKKLGIDVFVEDNWDIVKELKKATSSKLQATGSPRIFWITNLLDRNIPHEHKFYNLRGVVRKIRELTS